MCECEESSGEKEEGRGEERREGIYVSVFFSVKSFLVFVDPLQVPNLVERREERGEEDFDGEDNGGERRGERGR